MSKQIIGHLCISCTVLTGSGQGAWPLKVLAKLPSEATVGTQVGRSRDKLDEGEKTS